MPYLWQRSYTSGMKNTIFAAGALVICGGAAMPSAQTSDTADHYRAVASDCRARANEETGIAEHWKEHFGSWSKTPNPYFDARNMETAYNRCAVQAQRKADAMETMAKGKVKADPSSVASR
jgi:hypothetical protein